MQSKPKTEFFFKPTFHWLYKGKSSKKKTEADR